MWAHGLIVSAQEHHHMGDRSCLEHCLDNVQADSAGNGVVIGVVNVVVPVSYLPETLELKNSFYTTSIDSHHDPGQILTTIKRE